MTLPVWPANLPYSSRIDNWSQDQQANPVLKSDMNYGTTRQRQKYTLRVGLQKVQLVMSAADVLAFGAFVQSIGNGAARFTMPVWNGSEFNNRTVAIDGGTWAEAYFSPGYSLVSFSIRVENP